MKAWFGVLALGMLGGLVLAQGQTRTVTVNLSNTAGAMVTLYAIGGQAGGQFGAVMASSLIAVIPMVLIYLVFQKYYLQGLISSGIKG